MANKRPGSEESPVTNGVNGVKRRKTDSSHPNTDSPNSARQQPVLTADEREKLAQWLDKKANNDVDMFKITYPGGAGKGKKSPAKRPNGERLLLDGREYGEVAFAVANKQKWEQLTKYRRCTGKLWCPICECHLLTWWDSERANFRHWRMCLCT